MCVLGNRINAHVKGKILTLRPAVVENSPNSPIAWLCGDAQAVPGMTAVGDNRTNVPPAFWKWIVASGARMDRI